MDHIPRPSADTLLAPRKPPGVLGRWAARRPWLHGSMAAFRGSLGSPGALFIGLLSPRLYKEGESEGLAPVPLRKQRQQSSLLAFAGLRTGAGCPHASSRVSPAHCTCVSELSKEGTERPSNRPSSHSNGDPFRGGPWRPLQPPALPELLSRYIPDPGVRRPGERCPNPRGCACGGAGSRPAAAGGGGELPLTGRKWLPCQGDRLSVSDLVIRSPGGKRWGDRSLGGAPCQGQAL